MQAGNYIIAMGRRIHVTAAFDEIDDNEINRHMLDHPDEGVIEQRNGRVILAAMDDDGEPVVGQPVLCNGHRGHITKVCDWSNELVEVRVPGGLVCQSINSLIFL